MTDDDLTAVEVEGKENRIETPINEPSGIGAAGFPKVCLRRLCRGSLPKGCLIGSESLPAVAAVIETQVGEIVRLGLEGSGHKTLQPGDLQRGLERYHRAWFLREMEAPVRELRTAGDRLTHILELFGGVKHD